MTSKNLKSKCNKARDGIEYALVGYRKSGNGDWGSKSSKNSNNSLSEELDDDSYGNSDSDFTLACDSEI